MRDFVGEVGIKDPESKRAFQLDYYLLKSGTQYGVEAQLFEEGKLIDSATILGITEKASEIELLARYYLQHEVMPVTLAYMIRDYLADPGVDKLQCVML